MNRALVIIVVIALFLILPQAEGRENPFVSKQAPAKEIRLPAFASRLMGQVMLWQHELNTRLTEQVKRIKEEKSWQVFWPLMLACFLYGVVHAAGPGHGKVVVFSYFISRRSSVRQGILLGNLISLFHAVSGMVATISLAGVLTILGKEGLLRGLSRKEGAQHIVQKSLSILGSLLIIAFGAMLLSTVV